MTWDCIDIPDTHRRNVEELGKVHTSSAGNIRDDRTVTSAISPLEALSWSAPRLDGGDFTAEDPLAIDHLQQQIGNVLWPGFTTRTSRAFYYVMVCYGLRTVDYLLHEHGVVANDDNRRAWFERWERLWALAICASFDGAIPNTDAMRGKNGVVRAWRSRGSHFPLDYPLISRQIELGAMGAYRSSLVQHGLLSPDALRPTPIGAELADWMWAKGEAGDELDGFVQECLKPGTTHAVESHGRTTLKSLGRRCRLSIIRQRKDLQARLGGLLLDEHPPPIALRVLPEMARWLVDARADGVADTRSFIEGVASGQWGAPSPEVARNARVAVVFGDLASALRACFDRAYRAVLDGGYQAPFATVSAACLFDLDATAHVASSLAAWRDTPDAARMVRGEVHGGSFAAAAAKLDPTRPNDFLVHLLDLHRQVQVARGKSGAWLALDGDRVLMEAGNYRSWSLDGREWVVGYKVGTMTELLRDLGRVT